MSVISEPQRRNIWMAALRCYFVAVGVIALCCVRWKYDGLVHSFRYVGKSNFHAFDALMDSGSCVLGVILLLAPWWRLGVAISAICYAIAVPLCIYVIVGLSIVDLAYLHEQITFHLFLLSGVLAQGFWLFSRLRVESGQAAIVDRWKQHIRQKHRDKIELVERFILEMEGEEKDMIRASRFADLREKDDPSAMWKRLDAEWKRWSNR